RRCVDLLARGSQRAQPVLAEVAAALAALVAGLAEPAGHTRAPAVDVGLAPALDPVVAGRRLTQARALVGLVGVTVVAHLDARLRRPVAALRHQAGAQTIVGVVRVAVVAALAGLDLAVAAARKRARLRAQWISRRVAGLA